MEPNPPSIKTSFLWAAAIYTASIVAMVAVTFMLKWMLR